VKAAQPKPTQVARRFLGGWEPRHYQTDKIQQFDKGVMRHFYVWHRRAGKDNFGLNITRDQSQKRVGTYWHLFPLHVQARRAIWNGMDNEGVRFIEQAFGTDIVKPNNQDMMLELRNGSTWQLCGSDYYDRLVGSNPVGVVFSEWALCDPRAWDFIRPILRENGGWAMFITTFRGRNHAYRMYQGVKNNPEWSCEIRTVEQTFRNDKRRVFSEEQIQAERDDGMSEAMVQQEYYCNPLASADGALYGTLMTNLLAEGRTDAAYDPNKLVTAAWSFKYAPVNISVVFAQGNNVIGSRSWHFEDFQECYADTRRSFPWNPAVHTVMRGNGVDADMFDQHDISPDFIAEAPDPILIANARSFLRRANIDQQARKIEAKDVTNNFLLHESLNGYVATDRGPNAWAMSGISESHYLCSAFETYATWIRKNPTDTQWGKAPDYTLHDKATI
jgi:hypothetical protein